MNNLEDIQSRKVDLMTDFLYSIINCKKCPCYDKCESQNFSPDERILYCKTTIKNWLLEECEE